MHHRSWIAYVAEMAALLMAGAATFAAPVSYSGPGNQWSLELPDGWCEADAETLAEFRQDIPPEGGTLLTVFTPCPEEGKDPEPLFIMIASAPMDLSRASDQDIEAGFMKGFRQGFEKVKAQYAKQLTDMQLEEPVYDRQQHRIHYELVMTESDGSTIACAATSYLGQSGMITMGYYCLPEQLAAQRPAIARVRESFTADPAFEWKPRNGSSAYQFGRSVGRLIGIALLVAAVFWVVKRVRGA